MSAKYITFRATSHAMPLGRVMASRSMICAGSLAPLATLYILPAVPFLQSLCILRAWRLQFTRIDSDAGVHRRISGSPGSPTKERPAYIYDQARI